ncbi:MAG: transglutaminase family protein [Saccharospirillaceae bacterium]|nr:transglutaminase family protein [Pseudomonadales bacterium]NRB77952.1 transglutaminase family protein [Saccharospirillaceae bacterium]
MQQYLESSEFINCNAAEIITMARQLKGNLNSDIDISRACFEYVRDVIKHSWDYQTDIVTCKASDVLKYNTGFCYAKSHLLAALLRANKIPAGLCYQRISLSGEGTPYCLHGLNAVYLQDFGWYQMDARGNKNGVEAKFTPPNVQLAFTTKGRFETDIQGIWPQPLPIIVKTLLKYNTCKEVYANLPDIEIYS